MGYWSRNPANFSSATKTVLISRDGTSNASSSIAVGNTLPFSTTEMSMLFLYRNSGKNSYIAKGDGDFL
jgi:hypothetical protein